MEAGNQGGAPLAVAPKPSRAVHVFEVPPNIGDGTIRSLGFVKLAAEDELMAHDRAHGNPGKVAFETLKAAIVEINGKSVGLGDGSLDAAWKVMDPMIRQLCATAYAELHNVSEETTNSFLKSRVVKVG